MSCGKRLKRLIKGKTMQYISAAVLTYISSLGVNVLSDLQDESKMNGVGMFGFGPMSVFFCLVCGMLVFRFMKRKDIKLHLISLIAGFLLASASVFATVVLMKNNLFTSFPEVSKYIFATFTLTIFTTCFSEEIFLLFGKFENACRNKANKVLSMNFFLIWAIIFLAYIPLFLAWWPGNFFFDACYQMINVIDGYYSTHHPLAHTLLMGKAYMLGMRMNNVSLGYSIYTLLQMLFLSFSFAYVVKYTMDRRMPRWFSVMTLLWFALFPMHALFAISSTKDVIFAGAFLIFMVDLFRIFHDKEKVLWRHWISIILSGIIAVLFRNNGSYAILAGGILMIIFMKGWRTRLNLVIIISVVLIGGFGINKGLIAYSDAITNDNYREAMSVPLQCLGRVASYRKKDLAPELYEEICHYIREEDIPYYNPYNADPLKNYANEELLSGNTVNFFKLWIKVGLEFPDEYAEALISNTYGYWDPWKKPTWSEESIALSHLLIGKGDEIEKKNLLPPAYKIYSYLFWALEYQKVPLLGYLFRSDIYIWLLGFYLLWKAYRKDGRGFWCAMIPVMYFGTCLLGPMAALRYVYSLVVLLPLLFMNLNEKSLPLQDQSLQSGDTGKC